MQSVSPVPELVWVTEQQCRHGRLPHEAVGDGAEPEALEAAAPVRRDEQQLRAQLARQPTGFMPHDGYATRDHRSGPPLRQGNRVLIAPDPEAQTSGNCR